MKKNVKAIASVMVMVLIFYSSLFPNVLYALDTRTIVVSEQTGDNDSFATAQNITSDYRVQGFVNDSSDWDFYKVTVCARGNLTVSLSHASSIGRYTVAVYYSDYTPYSYIDTYDGVATVNAGLWGTGVTLYIAVGSSNGSYSNNNEYVLNFDISMPSYAFYSQNYFQGSSYVENMDLIYDYHRNSSSAANWETRNWEWNFDTYGCYVCSFSMVLNNLGKTTLRQIPNIMNANGADIPSEYMIAQPYVIMWANTSYRSTLSTLGTSFTYNASEQVYYTDQSANDMCLLRFRPIATLFGVNIEKYNTSGLTNDVKKNLIANLLADNPEGIIAIFKNSSKEHAIVFTDTSYISYPIDYSGYLSSTYTPYSSRSLNADDEVLGKGCVSDEGISLYAASDFDDGILFVACDPVNDSPNMEFTDTYTGRNFNGWVDLKEIYVIE